MLIKNTFELVNVNIKTTFNNTIINISTLNGNVIYITSAGNLGFKGSKKKNSFSAQKVAEKIILKLIELNIQKINIYIKGLGNNRDIILNSFSSFKILNIFDCTKIAYNGCRASKKRRI